MVRRIEWMALGAVVMGLVACSNSGSEKTGSTHEPPSVGPATDEDDPAPVTALNAEPVPMPNTTLDPVPAFLDKAQARTYYAEQAKLEATRADANEGSAKDLERMAARLDKAKYAVAIDIAQGQIRDLSERARIHRVRSAKLEALLNANL